MAELRISYQELEEILEANRANLPGVLAGLRVDGARGVIRFGFLSGNKLLYLIAPAIINLFLGRSGGITIESIKDDRGELVIGFTARRIA